MSQPDADLTLVDNSNKRPISTGCATAASGSPQRPRRKLKIADPQAAGLAIACTDWNAAKTISALADAECIGGNPQGAYQR